MHTIVKFIAAMEIHPDVQRNAQEEIARVVGADRLPSLEDRAALPYVNAVITESHRWHPALAVGLPHRVTKDEEYKGLRSLSDTWWLTERARLFHCQRYQRHLQSMVRASAASMRF